ncbi:MAG: hypothetical protein AAFR98_00905, partial [Pseudomonadota bacterium]
TGVQTCASDLVMLDSLKKTGLNIYVSTIYTAVPFEDPIWRKYAPIAINKFNDVIIAEASAEAIPVLHLQEVCTDAEDFSSVSPIEPSNRGGQKIVNQIVKTIFE